MAILASVAGRLDEFVRESERLWDEISESRDPLGQWAVANNFAVEALLRCDWERLEEALGRAPPGSWGTLLARAARDELRGDLEQALALLPKLEAAEAVTGLVAVLNGSRARLLARAGRLDEAAAALREWRQALPASELLGPLWASAYSGVDNAIVSLADDALAATSYETLLGMAPARMGFLPGGGLDQLRGNLALRLDLVDNAEQCSGSRGRRNIALCRGE